MEYYRKYVRTHLQNIKGNIYGNIYGICTDIFIISFYYFVSNTKIIAQGTPSQLINNQKARNAYFGEFFKIN